MAHGLSCSTAMWDLPGPGLEPVSPALAGGFPTTAPPGKSLEGYFLKTISLVLQLNSDYFLFLFSLRFKFCG